MRYAIELRTWNLDSNDLTDRSLTLAMYNSRIQILHELEKGDRSAAITALLTEHRKFESIKYDASSCLMQSVCAPRKQTIATIQASEDKGQNSNGVRGNGEWSDEVPDFVDETPSYHPDGVGVQGKNRGWTFENGGKFINSSERPNLNGANHGGAFIDLESRWILSTWTCVQKVPGEFLNVASVKWAVIRSS